MVHSINTVGKELQGFALFGDNLYNMGDGQFEDFVTELARR